MNETHQNVWFGAYLQIKRAQLKSLWFQEMVDPSRIYGAILPD